MGMLYMAHEELKYLDMITEKSEANVAAMPTADTKTVDVLDTHQQQPHGRMTVVARPPTSALVGHHHHHHHHHQPPPPPLPPPPPPPPQHIQPAPLHLNRTGGSLSVTDYRGAEPVISLESGGSGGGRRTAVNGSVSSNVMCAPNPLVHAAVCYPRPLYAFPLPPLTNATALWHHAQPHFPSSVAFPPFIENEWSRHCRLPIFNNQELQPEPVNLQNNHHSRRQEPGRALEIAARLQQERVAHNRPAPANPPAHDDREQTRHHA